MSVSLAVAWCLRSNVWSTCGKLVPHISDSALFGVTERIIYLELATPFIDAVLCAEFLIQNAPYRFEFSSCFLNSRYAATEEGSRHLLDNVVLSLRANLSIDGLAEVLIVHSVVPATVLMVNLAAWMSVSW